VDVRSWARRAATLIAGPERGFPCSEAELIDFCRSRLAPYKLPRSIRFVADLPKTSTGKIMRRQLRTLD
jgi:long-chain acyl-CoA synthetase